MTRKEELKRLKFSIENSLEFKTYSLTRELSKSNHKIADDLKNEIEVLWDDLKSITNEFNQLKD